MASAWDMACEAWRVAQPNSRFCAESMVALRLIPCLDVARGRQKGVTLLAYGMPAIQWSWLAVTAVQGRMNSFSSTSQPAMRGAAPRSTCVAQLNRSRSFPVGGGISTVEGITELLRAGADKGASTPRRCGAAELVREGADQFGQCIVVAIDAGGAMPAAGMCT